MADHYYKALLALIIVKEKMLALQMYQPPPTTVMVALLDRPDNLVQAANGQAARLPLPYQVTLNCFRGLYIAICIVIFIHIWLLMQCSWLYVFLFACLTDYAFIITS